MRKLLFIGMMLAASAAQTQTAQAQTADALRVAAATPPVVDAVLLGDILYASVKGSGEGRNDLAAKLCRLVSRYDGDIRNVHVVDKATTHQGRTPEEWRVIGKAEC